MAGKYMTIDEIAERWLCSKDYVRKLIISGQLSGAKLGGWKVRQDELLRFEKAKEKADTALSLAIAAYVYPYRRYQEQVKAAIYTAESEAEIHAIKIDYGSVGAAA